MKTKRHLRNAACLTVLAAALLATGCNGMLVGTWKAEAEPKDSPFYYKSQTYKDDNTYTALAKKGDEVVKLAGTYDFNGTSLTFKTPGKPDRVYKAMYILGGKLELKSDDLKQTLKKQ
jgi:hypothetical protein